MKKGWIGWVGFIVMAGIASAAQVPFIINPVLTGSTVGANTISDPEVTITTNASGNDLVYSFTYENVDLDGGGAPNDTLSWELRVEGFTGGVINGGTGMFRVGTTPAQVFADASQGWSVGDAAWAIREALQFSVTNIVLTADEGSSVTFDGFDSMWLTIGSYYFGEGGTTNPPQLIVDSNQDATFGAMDVLLITAGAGAERNRDLGGSFTVESTDPPVPSGETDWIGGGADAEFTTTNNWSSGEIPGSVTGRIDTATFLHPADDAVHTVDYIAAKFFDVLIRDGASLEIAAGLRIIRNFNIGTTGGTSVDVTQTAGVVVIRDQMNVGYVSDFDYDAKYSINGGIVRFTNPASTGVTVSENGIFEVVGNLANIDLDTAAIDFTLIDGGELRYVLGGAGVSSVDVGDLFTIGTESLLTIDASSYTGGEGSITLANFVSKSGSFDEANIAITGLEEGLNAHITYDATSMVLNVTLEPGRPRGRTRVFLLGGQSNMNGLASVTNVPPPYDAVQSGVKLWEKN